MSRNYPEKVGINLGDDRFPEDDTWFEMSRKVSVCSPTFIREDIVIESCAKVIYQQWENEQFGLVPWIDGGNSIWQDEARSLVRKALRC